LFILNYKNIKVLSLLALAFSLLQPITVLAASDQDIDGIRFRVEDIEIPKVRVSDILGSNQANQQRAQVSTNSNFGTRTVIVLGSGVDAQIANSLANDPFDAMIDNTTRFKINLLWRANIDIGVWNSSWTEDSVTVINSGSTILMTHQDGAGSGTIVITPTTFDRPTRYRNNGDPKRIDNGVEFQLDITNAKKNGIYQVNTNSITVEVTADFL
jgi:hypothetical protein